MNKTIILRSITTATAFLALAVHLLPSPLAAAERPNIVVIYADDLDFDDIGGSIYPVDEFPSRTGAWLTGNFRERWRPTGWALPYYTGTEKHTPNLDRMAREGARFDKFYITSPMCTPSRWSLLTGQYASRSDKALENTPANAPVYVTWDTYFTREEPSIAREMNNLGYTTGFIGKWHNGEPEMADPKYVHREYGDNPELLQSKLKESQEMASRHIRETLGFDVATHLSMGNLNNPKFGGHNMPWYTDGAVDFLEANHEKPFFLYMALPIPHSGAAWAHYEPELLMTPAGQLDEPNDAQRPFSEVVAELDRLGITQRSRSATWMDDSVGVILDKLEELGIAENTLVIFTSDHQSRGKFSVYEGARVPAVALWPKGIQPGTVIRDICANIDLVPTAVDLAGGEIPDWTDGLSFRENLLTGKPQHPERALLLETGYARAIVRGNYKYIANRPPNMEKVLDDMERDRVYAESTGERRRVGWKGGERPEAHPHRKGVAFDADADFPYYFDADQFYDLNLDVFEQFNRATDYAYQERVKELRKEMRQIISTQERPFPVME